jgi:hypothetical protein
MFALRTDQQLLEAGLCLSVHRLNDLTELSGLLTRELVEEVIRRRDGIRRHRDALDEQLPTAPRTDIAHER